MKATMRRLVRADPHDRWAAAFGRIALYSFLVALVSGVLLLPFFLVLGALLLLSYRSGRPRPVRVRRLDPLLPFTAGVLVLLGAAAQINPVWLYGPYQPGSISAGSVPDWYMGFLDGALRLMPGWELSFGGNVLALDVLIPAVIVPGLLFTLVAAYPLLDGRIAGGRPPRGLLPPKPPDPANRIGVGVAGITLYGLLWAAAADDEIAYHLQVSLYTVTWVFRVLVLTGPVLAFALTRMICHAVEARRHDEAEHGIETGRIVMTPEGGYAEIREQVASR